MIIFFLDYSYPTFPCHQDREFYPHHRQLAEGNALHDQTNAQGPKKETPNILAGSSIKHCYAYEYIRKFYVQQVQRMMQRIIAQNITI